MNIDRSEIDRVRELQLKLQLKLVGSGVKARVTRLILEALVSAYRMGREDEASERAQPR